MEIQYIEDKQTYSMTKQYVMLHQYEGRRVWHWLWQKLTKSKLAHVVLKQMKIQ